MSELPTDFDFHEYLNEGIKDEFSPLLEKIVATKIRKRKTRNLNSVIDNYFNSKEIKSNSAS